MKEWLPPEASLRIQRLVAGALLGATCGLVIAAFALRSPPYAAPYYVIIAACVGVAFFCLAAILAPVRRPQPLVALLLTAGICAPLVTYASLVAASRSTLWAQSMVSFGPDVPADLVVLLRENADDRQVFAFTETVLGRPHPVQGTMLPEHVTSLLAVHVGKHRGFALQLDDQATEADTRRLRRTLEQHDLVWRVCENIAPSRIPA